MIAGSRRWTSFVFMCIGSSLLSWHQKAFVSRFQSDFHLIGEWAPMENQGQSRTQSSQSAYLSEDEEGEGEDEVGTAFSREPMDGIIKSISILGERNSGTRWIYGHLGLCFNHTIPVLRSLSRYKHWFQYDDVTIPANTLSIAIFRDPITWTWAMKSVPHHASDHIDLPWKTFVTKEWTTKRLFKDEAWKDNQLANNKTGRICQERFHYHEVVSCLTRPYPEGYWGPHRKHRFSQHQPFYEMKPSGQPYNNILEMRADKIRNFLESAAYSNVEGFWFYQYESLLKHGTKELVEKIERATGVKRHPERCRIYEPQLRRKRAMDLAFIDYMLDHVDWKAEAMIGYQKPNSQTIE